MVLPDGRVGFIDFGLVGKVPASTWPALLAASSAFVSEDTEMLARALATLQATNTDVDIQVRLRSCNHGFNAHQAPRPRLTSR